MEEIEKAKAEAVAIPKFQTEKQADACGSETESDDLGNAASAGKSFILLERLRSFAVVRRGMSLVAAAVQKLREREGAAQGVMAAAEGVARTAAPYWEKLQGPLHSADAAVCKGLDTAVEKVLTFTEVPRQMFQVVMKNVSEVKEAIVKNVAALKDLFTTVVDEARSTKFGKIAESTLQKFVSAALYIPNKILPKETLKGEKGLDVWRILASVPSPPAAKNAKVSCKDTQTD